MNIVIIKSVIGEEILADLISDSHPVVSGAITVSRPRVFQFQQDHEGRMVPALVPWIMLDPDNTAVPINNDYIAAHIPAPDKVVKSYLTAVSSLDLTASNVSKIALS